MLKSITSSLKAPGLLARSLVLANNRITTPLNYEMARFTGRDIVFTLDTGSCSFPPISFLAELVTKGDTITNSKYVAS